MSVIHGIHHITAIASDPQKTHDFYTQVLGLRLVKKSVNQDDTSTYHLFFGDAVGSPGMDLTFFTFQPSFPGRRGVGQVTTISLAVPEAALPFWVERFEKLQINHDAPTTRFGRSRLRFYDQDDQQLELVGVSQKELEIGEKETIWTTKDISAAHAIRAFHSATLLVSDKALVEPIVQTFGYEEIATEDLTKLYRLPEKNRAAYLEIDETVDQPGVTMAGTVHHIAFAVRDIAAQLKMRQQLVALGLSPTPVIDRFYFKSVYFRTPAGILFEIATEGPGFTADEDEKELGKQLALPPFLEEQRAEIEAGLVPIVT